MVNAIAMLGCAVPQLMFGEEMMRIIFSSLIVVLLVQIGNTSASVPPQLIELTKTNAEALGFRAGVAVSEEWLKVKLEFPDRLWGTHVPHSSLVVTKNSNDEIVQEIHNRIDATSGSITTRYNSRSVDVQLSIIYCKEGSVSACKEVAISSLTKFAIPAAGN